MSEYAIPFDDRPRDYGESRQTDPEIIRYRSVEARRARVAKADENKRYHNAIIAVVPRNPNSNS